MFSRMEVGKCYLITTIRMFVIGKVIEKSLGEIVVENPYWVRNLGDEGYANISNGLVVRFQKINTPDNIWCVGTGHVQGYGLWPSEHMPPKGQEMVGD